MLDIDKIYYNGESNFVKAYRGIELLWDSTFEMIYIVFTANNDSQVGAKITGTLTNRPNVEYSLDKTNWYDLLTHTVSLSTGQQMYIRGKNTESFSIDNGNYFSFTIIGDVTIEQGNLWNLYDYELFNYGGLPTYLPTDFYFKGLFKGCTGLTNINGIILPYVNTRSVYHSLFMDCTQLSNVNTNVINDVVANLSNNYTQAQDTFNSAFRGCSSLTNTPTLTIQNKYLPNQTFANMFYNCRNLTDISNIDFTREKTVYAGSNAFASMFRYTGITSTPDLSTIARIKSGGMQYMFSNCPNLTSATVGKSGMITTDNANDEFKYMFSNCPKLNYIKFNLGSAYINESALENWTLNVATEGTFATHYESSYSRGVNGIPENWVVQTT